MIVTLIFSSPTPLTPMQTPACYTSQQPAPLHQTFPARLTKAPLLLQHRQPAGQALSTSLPVVSLHAATGHQGKNSRGPSRTADWLHSTPSLFGIGSPRQWNGSVSGLQRRHAGRDGDIHMGLGIPGYKQCQAGNLKGGRGRLDLLTFLH